MRSGKYEKQLKGSVTYNAFLPNSLPPKINIDDDLQMLIASAHTALGRLDGVSETVPNVDFFVRMYVKKEATLSSQVEGTQATLADVLKAEADIREEPIVSDVDEIVNYINAMNYGLEEFEKLPLSVRLIKNIHKILLKGVRGTERMPGELRVTQNWIGGTSIENATFVPAPPVAVPELLSDLEKFIHNTAPIPLLIKAGLIHSQFENIHPFLDGNGRIGRLLITFYLCQQGELDKPLLYLSSFFKKHREEYYTRLHAVHENDDVEGWLKFFLRGVAETSNEAVETARKIVCIREEDIKKATSLGRSSENAMMVLNELYGAPFVTLKHIGLWTELSKSNASALIKKLLTAGILQEVGTMRNREKVYCYERYYKLFSQ